MARIKSILIVLVIILFLLFSSGVVITIVKNLNEDEPIDDPVSEAIPVESIELDEDYIVF